MFSMVDLVDASSLLQGDFLSPVSVKTLKGIEALITTGEVTHWNHPFFIHCCSLNANKLTAILVIILQLHL